MALGLTPDQIIKKGTHPQLVIADEWERVELKKIASVQNGFAFSSKLFNRTEGMPLIRIRDIFSVETENLYLGEYKEDFVVNKGDILIGMDGDFKVSKWPGNKGLLNQRVCRIHFESAYYEKEFLFICIQPYLNAIHSETSAVTVKHLSSRTINDIPFPLPPLPEQRAIVAKIEELFSDLDKGIADLNLAKEQLVVFRQAVLKKAFEGELTREWREKNEITFDWEETNTGKAMPDINSGSTPKSDFLFDKGEIQFLKVYNLNFDGTLNSNKNPAFTTNEVHNSQNKRAITIAGDVLINIVGPPLGKVSMIPLNSKKEFNINQAIVRFRPNEKITSKFLCFFLQNPATVLWLESKSNTTAGQHNVKVTTCREIPTNLPSIKEQNQIVKEIESRLSVCDKVEQSIIESLEKAKALRQSILKKAFEGKLLSAAEIERCKQEEDYEPASVLLEKIKKENKK